MSEDKTFYPYEDVIVQRDRFFKTEFINFLIPIKKDGGTQKKWFSFKWRPSIVMFEEEKMFTMHPNSCKEFKKYLAVMNIEIETKKGKKENV